MTARSNSDAVSELPVFEIKRSQDYDGWLNVTCPRDDCGEFFLVRAKTFLAVRRYGSKQTLLTGRPCPYCFKAGRLPARSRIR